MDLRDELAQLHLDDGVVQLDFQELHICLDVLAGLAGVWREDSQHPHVAADHHLVCRLERQEGTSRLTNNNLRTSQLIHVVFLTLIFVSTVTHAEVVHLPQTDRVHFHCCPRPQHTSILGQTPLLHQAQPTTSHGP